MGTRLLTRRQGGLGGAAARLADARFLSPSRGKTHCTLVCDDLGHLRERRPHFTPRYFPSRALLAPYWAAQIHAGKGVSEKPESTLFVPPLGEPR